MDGASETNAPNNATPPRSCNGITGRKRSLSDCDEVVAEPRYLREDESLAAPFAPLRLLPCSVSKEEEYFITSSGHKISALWGGDSDKAALGTNYSAQDGYPDEALRTATGESH